MPKYIRKFHYIRKFFLKIFESSPTSYACSTNAETLAKYYLQLGGLNNWFYVVITSFAQHLNAVQNWGMTAPFTPRWLSVRPRWLMAVWFWSFGCNCKPVDNSRWPRITNMAWLGRSVADTKMLSLLLVRSFRLHHISLSRKATSGEDFNFLLVTVVLAMVRGLELVIGWPGWIHR